MSGTTYSSIADQTDHVTPRSGTMTYACQSTEDTTYTLYSDTSVDGMDWGSRLLADMRCGYVVTNRLHDGTHSNWYVGNAIDKHDFRCTPMT